MRQQLLDDQETAEVAVQSQHNRRSKAADNECRVTREQADGEVTLI